MVINEEARGVKMELGREETLKRRNARENESFIPLYKFFPCSGKAPLLRPPPPNLTQTMKIAINIEIIRWPQPHQVSVEPKH